MQFFLVFRYTGVPIDFEVVDIDPQSEGNDDIEYAIQSIKRFVCRNSH